MPKKWEKNRKRRTRATGSVNNGSSVSVSTGPRRGSSVPQTACPSSAAASAAGGSGRNTNNSRGNRGLGKRGPTPKKTPRRQNGGGGGTKGRGAKGSKKDTSHLQDPLSYTDPASGEVYKPGDCAYVDSQQADLPYHICVIQDFKWARKDSLIAELKWFYRVSELPESVYSLLMEDRNLGKASARYSSGRVRDRELFVAFNLDTHPAALFRGKCQVRDLSEVKDILREYVEKDDHFFYTHGYKPESRRLTDMNEESFVPCSQQAEVPAFCEEPATVMAQYQSRPSCEEMTWGPQQIEDDQLLMYLRAARSIALHAGVCMQGYMADGYLAASSDETTQNAFDVLHRNTHNTEKALQDLVKRPIVSYLVGKKNWSKENMVLFAKGMRQFGKNFFKIQKELLPSKSIRELSEYYYYWKKTSAGLSSRSTRRQRKQAHIRMNRAVLKPSEQTPEIGEFVELCSCDEDEGDGEEMEKPKSCYACRHCFSTDSPNWHHAGISKTILCQECRLFFLRYGQMRPITDQREPPEFMFKHYEELAMANDNSAASSSSGGSRHGRKTRNSNGTRSTSRPGLRSGKNYSKSDTDEEEDPYVSDSSESSSEEEVHHCVPTKPKLLQTQCSIINNLDTPLKQAEELPPAKRAKREENEVNDSEEDGSTGSTNGEADTEGTSKFPEGEGKSPSQSLSSSNGDEEGDSPRDVHTPSADPLPANLSEHFRRESKDPESTCARTELVYKHPPAEEKRLSMATNKVIASLPGPGGSHGSEPGPSAHTPSSLPIITPHAPQLPAGPPAFTRLPFAESPSNPLLQRTLSMEHSGAAAREQEKHHMALWHHQQQQQWLQAMMHQKQLELHGPFPHVIASQMGAHPHAAAVPAGFVPGHALPPHSVEAAGQQPMIFTFPTPEDMARQRMAAPFNLPPEHLAMLPPGVLPQAIPTPLFGQLRPEEQVRGVLPTPQFIPVNVSTAGGGAGMEMLVQPQQQQQLAAMATATGQLHPGPQTPEQVVELYHNLVATAQKEPAVMQTPQFQLMMTHCRQHLVAMQQHGVLPEVFEQMRLQEQHQQQQLAMAAAMGRQAQQDDRGARPGVIVHSKMGT